MIETTPLTPILGARITGIDIARGVDAARMAELRDALDRFSVLVFPDQRNDDAAQIAPLLAACAAGDTQGMLATPAAVQAADRQSRTAELVKLLERCVDAPG